MQTEWVKRRYAGLIRPSISRGTALFVGQPTVLTGLSPCGKQGKEKKKEKRKKEKEKRRKRKRKNEKKKGVTPFQHVLAGLTHTSPPKKGGACVWGRTTRRVTACTQQAEQEEEEKEEEEEKRRRKRKRKRKRKGKEEGEEEGEGEGERGS